MHQGVSEYGCEINQGKTQVNFDPAVLERAISNPNADFASTLVDSALLTKTMVLTLPTVGWTATTTTANDGMSVEEDSVLPEWLQWCGLYIHSKDLRVRGDYSRLCGTYIADTITLDNTIFRQEELVDKLFSFIQPKCHAMMLDSRINSLNEVWLNLYQVI